MKGEESAATAVAVSVTGRQTRLINTALSARAREAYKIGNRLNGFRSPI
jgi:hypothetical protein